LGTATSVLTRNPLPIGIAASICFPTAQADESQGHFDINALLSKSTSQSSEATHYALDIFEQAGLLKGYTKVNALLGSSLTVKNMIEFQEACLSRDTNLFLCLAGNIATQSVQMLGDRVFVGITAAGVAEVIGGIATIPGGIPVIVDGTGKIILGLSGIGTTHALAQNVAGFIETQAFAVEKTMMQGVNAYTQFAIVEPALLLTNAISQADKISVGISHAAKAFLKKIYDKKSELNTLQTKQREFETSIKKSASELEQATANYQKAEDSYRVAKALADQKQQAVLDSARRVQNAYNTAQSAVASYNSMVHQYEALMQGCDTAQGALRWPPITGPFVYFCGLWPNIRHVPKASADQQHNALQSQNNHANSLIATHRNLWNAHQPIQADFERAAAAEKQAITRHQEAEANYQTILKNLLASVDEYGKTNGDL
jgi:hypothetical protein